MRRMFETQPVNPVKKAFVICFLLFVVFSGSILAAGAGTAQEVFKDLPRVHWAYSNIMGLKEINIATGYPDGTFRPDEPISRLEYIALLSRITDKMGILYDPDAFKDTDSYSGFDFKKSWACKEWRKLAKKYEMTKPDMGDKERPGVLALKNTFGDSVDMEGNITRDEAAALISPFLICEPDKKDLENPLLTDVSDSKNRIDIVKAFKYGILTGYPDKSYKPSKDIQRAEAFAVLKRFMDKCSFIEKSVNYAPYKDDLRIIFSNMMMDRFLEEAKTAKKFIPSYPIDDFTDFRAMIQNVFMLERAGKLDEAFKYYTMIDYVEYFDDLKEFYMKVPRNRIYDPDQACYRNAYKLFAEIIDISETKKLAHMKMVSRNEDGSTTDYSVYRYFSLYKNKWYIDFNGTSIGSGKYDDPYIIMGRIPNYINFDADRYGIPIELP